jgi:hypothetical protein
MDKEDIFSFGYIVWFLCYNEYPHEKDRTGEKQIGRYLKERRDFGKTPLDVDLYLELNGHHYSSMLEEIIVKCWKWKAVERPSAQCLLKYLKP